MVDGQVYHFNPENRSRSVNTIGIFPFIMIAQLKPTLTKSLPSLAMPTLHTALAPLLPSKQNSFLSVRVDGVFSQVAFRMIPAPPREQQPLFDLLRRQRLQSAHNVRGLLFGFWSPGCSNGFSVAGFHLHFISDDRTAGGHVTGFEAWDVKLSAGVLKEYGAELPQDEDFLEAVIRNYEEDQNLR